MSPLPPRPFFLVTDGFLSTVIESQVVDTAVALGRAGTPTDVVMRLPVRALLRTPGRVVHDAVRYARALRPHGRLWPLPVARPLSLPARTSAAALLSALPVARRPGAIAHARGHHAALLALALRRFVPGLPIVFDVRGDALAELDMRAAAGDASASRERAATKRAVRAALRGANAVLAVSTRLAKRLVDTEPSLAPQRIHVLPCLADAAKFSPRPEAGRAIRRRLGWPAGAVVGVFSGSAAPWNYLPETLALAAAWLRRDPRGRLLLLTPDVGTVSELATARLPAGRWVARHVPHAEVADWLSAADFGLLLRARDPVNTAAAPTKFAEYLLCGLPVVTNGAVADYADYVRTEGAGLVLDERDVDAAAAHLTAALPFSAAHRSALAAAARRWFTKDRLVATLQPLYAALAAGSPLPAPQAPFPGVPWPPAHRRAGKGSTRSVPPAP